MELYQRRSNIMYVMSNRLSFGPFDVALAEAELGLIENAIEDDGDLRTGADHRYAVDDAAENHGIRKHFFRDGRNAGFGRAATRDLELGEEREQLFVCRDRDEITEPGLDEFHSHSFQHVLAHALGERQRLVVGAVQIGVVAIAHAGAVVVHV